MTLIDKVLKESGMFPEIDPEELSDVSDVVEKVLTESGSSHFYKAKVEPYGTGFKVLLTKNESGIANLLNGLDERLCHGLGWENIDLEEANGDFVIYYR